jgi:hypothetical protein
MPELTASTRELARRIGVTETALRKAEAKGRITREPDGQWDVEKSRRRMIETADPVRSPLAGAVGAGTTQAGLSNDATPYARLRVAQLALKVEAQRMALDEDKGRLLDAVTANAAIDEIAGAMRDALLNWPARVSGLIAADLGVEPHLVQTVLQQHVADLLTEAADRFDPPGLGDRSADR